MKKCFRELVDGRKECQCRKDMQWNREALECQVGESESAKHQILLKIARTTKILPQ